MQDATTFGDEKKPEDKNAGQDSALIEGINAPVSEVKSESDSPSNENTNNQDSNNADKEDTKDPVNAEKEITDGSAKKPVEEERKEAKQESPAEDSKSKSSFSHSTVSSSGADDVADSLETEQVVVFKLENEEYAAPILTVQEIIPTGDITPFPNVPSYIAGIINVRGTVATVINLSGRFNLTRKETDNIDKYIILTKNDKSLYGVMVDDVTSVMKIPLNKIKDASSTIESKINNNYIEKVAVTDNHIILILDFKKILEEEAIQNIASEASLPDEGSSSKKD